MKKLRGVIHGKAIELDEQTGLAEGQEVTVTVQPVARTEAASSEAMDALKRAAGSWTDDMEGLDRYLEWNRQQRKVQRQGVPE